MPTPATLKYTAFVEFKDKFNKKSKSVIEINAAAFTAYNTDVTTGVVRAWIDATAALSLAQETGEGVNFQGRKITAAVPLPTGEGAVNSAKLIVIARDTITGDPTKTEIPARDTANYTSDGNGVVDLTAGDALAYKTAYEAAAKSDDGNAVQIVQMRVVGR